MFTKTKCKLCLEFCIQFLGKEGPQTVQDGPRNMNKSEDWHKYLVRTRAGPYQAHLREHFKWARRGLVNRQGRTPAMGKERPRIEYLCRPSLLTLCGVLPCHFAGPIFARSGPLIA